MILYIVRHAWAGSPDDPRYPDDALRPLTDKGRKRFRRVARRLAKRGMAPARVATSPLVRCRETAEILVKCTGKPPLTVLEQLAPGARLDELLPWTREHGAGDVAWVGHAPDVGRLAAALIGADGECIDLAKGAVAAIEFDDEIAAGRGTLRWLATAELLGK